MVERLPRYIWQRMEAALVAINRTHRRPKAFYLGPADWAAFIAAADARDTVTLPWGNNPVQQRTDPAFNGLPVRKSKSDTEVSRLYDHVGVGREI